VQEKRLLIALGDPLVRLLNCLAVLALTAIATPALAAAEEANDKGLWIALGVVFMGSFTAILGGVMAAYAKKKQSGKKDLTD
jgi:uncharacterized membrane protein YeiH